MKQAHFTQDAQHGSGPLTVDIKSLLNTPPQRDRPGARASTLARGAHITKLAVRLSAFDRFTDPTLDRGDLCLMDRGWRSNGLWGQQASRHFTVGLTITLAEVRKGLILESSNVSEGRCPPQGEGICSSLDRGCQAAGPQVLCLRFPP